jgi:phosphatidylinositol glycan class N
MPTESRPCHIAMFAGFYEDVSAVTTGWQENVVEFDSVFNQSNYVLQIGSPDVVKIFRSDHIDSLYYAPELEDFAGGDPSTLDEWVFNEFERIISKDVTDRTPKEEQIRNKLHSNKNRIFIFLHLLGLDTAGHAYKPAQQGYRDALTFVDRGIEKIHHMVNEFFDNDNRTAFIFTADHGMSSRGAHGDGNPECTRTPFLSWGSGVRASNEEIGRRIISDGLWTDSQKERKMITKEWQLDPSLRKDVEQADIAPLLSSLLGIPVPTNSIGTLPVGYLAGDDRFMAFNLYLNARQMLEQFHTKEDIKRKLTPFFFVPYGAPISAGLNQTRDFLADIEKAIQEGEYTRAQEMSRQLIDVSKKGFDYYQTYDWAFLMTTITAGYLGWMLYLLDFCLKNYTSVGKSTPKREYLYDAATVVFTALLVAYLHVQNAPFMYYLYVAFPIYFYNSIIKDIPLLVQFLSGVSSYKAVKRVFICAVGLEAMVYGYFHREMFSVCFLLIGIAPVLVEITFQNRFGWLATCIFASLFTLIDVNVRSSTTWVCLGGIWIIIKQLIWNKFTDMERSRAQKLLFFIQLFVIAAATWIVHSTDSSLAKKQGLPLLNQYASIAITIISILLPLLSSNTYKVRVQSLFMGLAAPLILLSVAYEVFFFSSLDMFVYIWLKREVKRREAYNRPSNEQTLYGQDFATAMFYVCLFLSFQFTMIDLFI